MTTHTLTYGTAEIVEHLGALRFDVYRPFKVAANEPWNAAVRTRVFSAGPSDVSSWHPMNQGGYDSRCSCCYLGFTHTIDRHAKGIAGTP